MHQKSVDELAVRLDDAWSSEGWQHASPWRGTVEEIGGRSHEDIWCRCVWHQVGGRRAHQGLHTQSAHRSRRIGLPTVKGLIVKKAKLAIEGGSKAVTNKLAGWPQFDEKAIKAVELVLRSGKVNYWTGPKGMEFEKQFATWQGSRFAISTSSGTSALHVALSALGIGPGDEVIVPSYTFIASSFSIVQAGAIPRFADVNLDDHCISVASAEKLVNKRTKAIMPVHLYGNVCDMDPIVEFARKHKLYVVEDNAEAFGGVYKSKKTGTLGHIAACSF
ncbi:MAG: aminotransferase class I/II-fold pyridoxal phosphate-dependent enzyme, partial [Planctomycetaceae bacterium]